MIVQQKTKRLSSQSTDSRRLLEIEKNRRERVVEAMHNKDFLTPVGNEFIPFFRIESRIVAL